VVREGESPRRLCVCPLMTDSTQMHACVQCTLRRRLGIEREFRVVTRSHPGHSLHAHPDNPSNV
jgi:hypothetical protein